jgi:hypothetical protein
MSHADTDDAPPPEVVDPEMRQLLGLFDVPAFARRGQDLEHAHRRLHERCREERSRRLEMVRLRLRQWSAGVEGAESWRTVFTGPLDALWLGSGAPEPAAWGKSPASPRRRRLIARDLIASVERFNRLWLAHVEALDLSVLNTLVDHYNRYYVLEKECVFRSARVAARHFAPRSHVSAADLLQAHPLLPVPTLLR